MCASMTVVRILFVTDHVGFKYLMKYFIITTTTLCNEREFGNFLCHVLDTII